MKRNNQILITLSTILFCVASCKKNETTIGAKKLDCTYSNNTTLVNHNNGVDYICDCDVQIMSGTLTIEKGVSIQFSSGGGIAVNNNAAIVAKGTDSEPVTLQGASTGQGSWMGLLVQSNNVLNEFSYTQIVGGGNRIMSLQVAERIEDVYSSVHVVGRLKMSNTSISKSQGVGFVLHPTGTISEFNKIAIEQSSSYPVFMYAGQLNNTALSTCTFLANTKNFVALYAVSSVSVVSEAATFVQMPIPYFAFTSLNFEGNVAFAAGAQLVVAANELVSVKKNAAMRINGTASNPVIIRGENAVAGFWKGLLVASNNATNIFDYLEISDGGSEPAAFASQKANITVSDLAPAKLTLNNCKSFRVDGCELTYSTTDATVTNNSSNITNVCTF